jgi:hypothetical protein
MSQEAERAMTYRGHIRNGVAVLDTPTPLPDGTPVRVEVDRADSAFWQNKSVDELAREQQVKPIQSIEELRGDWPEEDSIDEFLAFIREARR